MLNTFASSSEKLRQHNCWKLGRRNPKLCSLRQSSALRLAHVRQRTPVDTTPYPHRSNEPAPAMAAAALCPSRGTDHAPPRPRRTFEVDPPFSTFRPTGFVLPVGLVTRKKTPRGSFPVLPERLAGPILDAPPASYSVATKESTSEITQIGTMVRGPAKSYGKLADENRSTGSQKRDSRRPARSSERIGFQVGSPPASSRRPRPFPRPSQPTTHPWIMRISHHARGAGRPALRRIANVACLLGHWSSTIGPYTIFERGPQRRSSRQNHDHHPFFYLVGCEHVLFTPGPVAPQARRRPRPLGRQPPSVPPLLPLQSRMPQPARRSGPPAPRLKRLCGVRQV